MGIVEVEKSGDGIHDAAGLIMGGSDQGDRRGKNRLGQVLQPKAAQALLMGHALVDSCRQQKHVDDVGGQIVEEEGRRQQLDQSGHQGTTSLAGSWVSSRLALPCSSERSRMGAAKRRSESDSSALTTISNLPVRSSSEMKACSA